MKKMVIAVSLVLLIIAAIAVNAMMMKNTTDSMLQHMDDAIAKMNIKDFDSAKQDMDALLDIIEDKRVYFGLVTSKENLEELEDSALPGRGILLRRRAGRILRRSQCAQAPHRTYACL